MSLHTLDALALLEALPQNLPSEKKNLRSPQDAIAALVHTMLSALGFQLVAVDENAPVRTYENNVLPEEWNQHGPGSYTFRYKHEQSSSELLVKVVKLGSRVLISSFTIESETTSTLDLSADDLTASSFFPLDLTSSSASSLVDAFISSNRIDDFVSQFKGRTLRGLMPGLPKPASTERTDAEMGPSRLRETEAAPPARVQLEGPPHPEAPPQNPRSTMPYPPPTNPLEIGRRDRDPFPSNPFAPPPLFSDNGGDGMFVGPDHPIFGAGMRGRGPGGMGPWGGDGYLPPLGAPPGARFDPVGPGIGPGAPFPGGGMRPRGGGGPLGGQDPDFDDFPPPGSRDMFM